ncbi:MAG TPA: hypothetical protein VGJ27_08850 [Gaiellaceae bacterium]|jgi:hypothetical protein
MRKTLLALFVCAAMPGAVAVSAAAPPNSVTIALSRPSVVYGGTVKLSGAVSNHQAGESVTLLADPFGQTGFIAFDTLNTVSGGKWSETVKPTIQTSYEAKYKQFTSQPVTVKVRPLISLELVNLASRTFSTTVTGARSFQGKFVLVQRLTSDGTLTLKKLKLNASSSATFRVRLHSGRNRLRIVMPTSQTSPGYIAGYSKVLSVRRP